MLKKYNVLKDGRVQHVTATDFNTAKVGFSNAFGQIPTRNQILKLMDISIGSKIEIVNHYLIITSNLNCGFNFFCS